MKYVKQLMIILLVSLLGEVLHAYIPLPIPASIYGLILMLAGLCTGAIKLAAVEETAKFLVSIMQVMFIPAAVGLLDAWGVLRPVLLPVTVIMVVSTVLVMVVSGKVAQWVQSREGKAELK